MSSLARIDKAMVVLSQRTKELERAVERLKKAYIDAGFALLEIRGDKRYKEYGYDSFDAYCRDRWGLKRSYVHDVIASARVVAQIETSAMADVLPSNERQVRALRESDNPAEVWAEVVEQHAPEEITAAVIREHVEARKPQPVPVEVIEDAEVVTPVDSFALMAACDAIEEAMRVYVRPLVLAAQNLGATSQETYDAQQRGLR